VNEGTERWLPVIRYEGLYEVSDLGRVRSLDRLVGGSRGPASQISRGRILKPCLGRRGYLHVSLSRDGNVEHCDIHLLVLEAFVGPPKPGQEGRHGPNGKLNNRLTELCWGTRPENCADKLRDGTDNQGMKHANAKLTDIKVREIRTRAAQGEVYRLIAADYNVSVSNISLVVRREAWTHVT
jgi:hypothetical protein